MSQGRIRKYFGFLAILIFIGIIIGGELLVLELTPFNSINRQEGSQQGGDKEEHCSKIEPWTSYSGPFQQYACTFVFKNIIFFDSYHDTINAISTLLVAIFTFTLWRSTNKLWDAGERQFKFLVENQDRPVVDVDIKFNGKVVEHVSGKTIGIPYSGTVIAKFSIHNFGRTPAIILEMHTLSFDQESVPDKIGFPPPFENKKETITIPAGGASNPIPIPVPYGEESVGDAFKYVWVVLQIRFRDIFHRQYLSNYLFLSRNAGATFVAKSGHKKSDHRELTGDELIAAEERDG